MFAEVREEGWPSWSVNHEVGEAVEAFTVLKVKRVLLWETSVAERQKLEGEVSCISALEMRWGEQWGAGCRWTLHLLAGTPRGAELE